MRRPDAPPTRLLGLRPGDDPAGMGRLVRSSVNAPRDAVPRLKGRIRSTLRRRSVWRRRYVRAGVVGVVIFVAGGVVGAMVQPIIRFHKQHRVESVENVFPRTSPSRGRRTTVARPLAPESRTLLDEELQLSAELPAMVEAPIAEPSAGMGLSEFPPSPSLPSLPVPAGSSRAAARGSSNSPSHSLRAPAPPGAATHEPATPQPPPAHRSGDGTYPRIAMLEPPRQYEPQAAPSRADSPPASRPQPSVAAPAAPAPTSAPARVAAPVAPAPPAPIAPPPSALLAPASSEQVLLSRALRSLRSQRRPDEALAILDAYAARFPHGSLGPEAGRLRTEALLALGQKPAALAELNRDLGSNTVGAEENRLVRGELHADAGRWQDALLDFDAVARARLAHQRLATTSPSSKLQEHLERALWGRASARSQLGDHAGATADLRDYLQRFPRGRFAAQAGHLLGELR